MPRSLRPWPRRACGLAILLLGGCTAPNPDYLGDSGLAAGGDLAALADGARDLAASGGDDGPGTELGPPGDDGAEPEDLAAADLALPDDGGPALDLVADSALRDLAAGAPDLRDGGRPGDGGGDLAAACGLLGRPCCNGQCSAPGTSCQGNQCQPCGGNYQVCCPNGACSGGAACVQGQCRPCGAAYQDCCANSTCNKGHVCNRGQCRPCGAAYTDCCANSTCDKGNACFNGQCRPCGAANQECCANATCNQGLVCSFNSCRACGGIGQPCCGGNACTGNRRCIAGFCV